MAEGKAMVQPPTDDPNASPVLVHRSALPPPPSFVVAGTAEPSAVFGSVSIPHREQEYPLGPSSAANSTSMSPNVYNGASGAMPQHRPALRAYASDLTASKVYMNQEQQHGQHIERTSANGLPATVWSRETSAGSQCPPPTWGTNPAQMPPMRHSSPSLDLPPASSWPSAPSARVSDFGAGYGHTRPQARFSAAPPAAHSQLGISPEYTQAGAASHHPSSDGMLPDPRRSYSGAVALRQSVSGAMQQIATTPAYVTHVQLLCRLLLVLYFANAVYSEFEEWRKVQGVNLHWLELRQLSPYAQLEALVLYACPVERMATMAVCAALLLLGIAAPLCSLALAGCVLHHLWKQPRDAWTHFGSATETANILAYKELAVAGAACMLAAQLYSLPSWLSFSRTGKSKTTALLGSKRGSSPGKAQLWRAGFLLLLPLFVVVGVLQVQQVRVLGAHGYMAHLQGPEAWWLPLPQDSSANSSSSSPNAWLCLQVLLAVPLFLACKARLPAALMAVVLLAEAVACWQFWSARRVHQWEHVAYVRRHCFASLAVAAGALLAMLQGAEVERNVMEVVKKKQL